MSIVYPQLRSPGDGLSRARRLQFVRAGRRGNVSRPHNEAPRAEFARNQLVNMFGTQAHLCLTMRARNADELGQAEYVLAMRAREIGAEFLRLSERG